MGMITLPAFAENASGTVGELQWSVENNTLKISGTGVMENYSPGTAPWNEYKDRVTYAEVAAGVKSIGDYAFSGFKSLSRVSIPESVTYMGVDIFDGCSALTTVTGGLARAYIEEYSDKYDITLCDEPEYDIPRIEEEPGIGNVEDHITRAAGNIGGISWEMQLLTLRIKGSGSLADLKSAENVPWRAYAGQIRNVYISSGVTGLGGALFEGASDFSICAAEGSEAQKYAIANNIAFKTAYEYVFDCGYNISEDNGKYIYTDIVTRGDRSRVMYSAICTAAALAEKNGLGFEGWSEKPGSSELSDINYYSFDAKRSASLYAVYTEPYIAKYHFGKNITTVSVGEKYVFDGAPVCAAEALRPLTGFEAEGWRYDMESEEPQFKAGEEIPLTERTTDLYAVYSRDVTLKYIDGGNETDVTEKQYLNGSEALERKEFTVADAAARDGYEFAGWAKGSPDGERVMPGSTLSVTEDTELYAVWEENAVTASPYIAVTDIYGGKKISISCAAENSVIYYSVDGGEPTELYSMEFEITTPQTVSIKAIAKANGSSDSPVSEKTVTVEEAAAPVSSAVSGEYESCVETELYCETAGADIYYSLDGSDPLYGKKYEGKLVLNDDTELMAVARAYGYADSAASEYSFKVTAKHFKMLRDNYSFANSRSSFGYGGDYGVPLERYVDVLGNARGTEEYLARKASNRLTWGGSCFGFSSTSALFFEDIMQYTDYYSAADSLYDIPAPKDPNAELTKLIESYQISQLAYPLSNERTSNYSTRNSNTIREIAAAVQSFEKTGQDPIVIDVWGYRIDANGNFVLDESGKKIECGHAVLPYACVKNADGSYSIYVYDNNNPTDRNRIITIDKSMSSFLYPTSYCNYNRIISYQKFDTILEAYSPNDADRAVNNYTTLTVSADDTEIKTTDGTPIELVNGAYEILDAEEEINSDIKKYLLPEGNYIVTEIGEGEGFKVSVTDKSAYTTVSTKDDNSSVLIRVSESKDLYVHLYSENGGEVEVMNSDGVKSYMQTPGNHIGICAAYSEIMDVTADDDVLINGEVQSVGRADAIGTAEITVDAADSDAEKTFSAETALNALSIRDGALMGEFALNVYNNSGRLTAASIIMCLYDGSGALVSILESDNTVLGLGRNYIKSGEINAEISDGDYRVKCFVWDSAESAFPLTEAISLSV